MRIDLTDNNCSAGNNVYDREKVGPLFRLADKRISQLCNENENLLIFPYSLSDVPDKLGDNKILSLHSTTDPDKVKIVTGNIMGFFGTGNLRVSIKSRFDDGREDFMLHYMLRRVLSFSLLNLDYPSGKEEILDLLMLLFPSLLGDALRQGLYREYRTFRHNDSNLRGPLDVNRHIKCNVPFRDSVAYSAREFSRDNDTTQLIRHTIEYMSSRQLGRAVLGLTREVRDNVAAIIRDTPSYNKAQRKLIIGKNLRMSVHPFYTAYNSLRVLCLQILRQENIKYGPEDREISGLLFDGAWLWEEYINLLLSPLCFVHPENKMRKKGIYLFADNTGLRYPDFYRDDLVLDAKYKRLGSCERVSEVDRDDLHQLISYMAALKVNRGGFVAPFEKVRTKLPVSRLRNSDSLISIFGVEISREQESFSVFCEEMERAEKRFINQVLTFRSR